MQDSLQKLVRKTVVVVTHGGINYRGQLIEASEDTMFLKGETGWVTIPMEKIISVREYHAEDSGEWRDRDIDPSFFNSK